MSFKPSALIQVLQGREGPDVARAIEHLRRMEKNGCKALSLGTFAPGHEPRSWEAWAKAFSDLQDWIATRTPEQNAADLRAGEDFLKLDAALCERDHALNILAEMAIHNEALVQRVRKTYRGDALRYFENSLHMAQLVESRTAPSRQGTNAAPSS
jgi:hypothetical protein